MDVIVMAYDLGNVHIEVSGSAYLLVLGILPTSLRVGTHQSFETAISSSLKRAESTAMLITDDANR